MKPIAVFYHGLLAGPGLDSDWLFTLLANQIAALVDSGLAQAATSIFFGVNGDETDRMAVQSLAPGKAVVIASPQGKTELPTMILMQNWCATNPGWNVLYWHMKGAQYPNNPTWNAWRKCMTLHVIWGWQECVAALESGYDSAGAHWMTSQRYPMIPPSQRYWGGNFFWASSDFLRTLPPIGADSSAARYNAEAWIGTGKKAPRVRDLAPHFPMNCPR